MKHVVYTDGACSGNPGPGACVSIIDESIYRVKAYIETTNNRMELRAVIMALEYLTDDEDIEIISDSQYVVDAVNKNWLVKWISSDIEKRPNKDLWKILWSLLTNKNCTFTWCRAHGNNTHNNEADKLARSAIKYYRKETDIGYENKTFSKK